MALHGFGSPGFKETPEFYKEFHRGHKLVELYKKFRPTYPKTLYDAIIKDVEEKTDGPLGLAVDVCCGTGQSTLALSPHFEQVIGIDASVEMIEEAKKDPQKPSNVQYRVGNAMNLPFDDKSVQLITIATALHWMVPLEDFFREVRRVLSPGGCLAAYGYVHMKCHEDNATAELVDDAVKECIDDKNVNPFKSSRWEVGLDLYKDLHLPFCQFIRHDAGYMDKFWTPDEMAGMLSSVAVFYHYHAAHPDRESPLQTLKERLLDICNQDATKKIHFKFPLYLLVGRKLIEN